MRRNARSRETTVVSPRHFAWPRAAIATLSHATLPWFDGFALEIKLEGDPLALQKDLGTRDRLSLLAQFAAHQAFLQFAGLADSAMVPAEWLVVRSRGSDCRLIRVAAADSGPVDDVPVTHLLQQFAALIDAPALDTLRHSWVRPESVYAEVHSRLRSAAVSDLRWMRRAASGAMNAPGADALRAIWEARRGQMSYSDERTADSIAAMALLDESISVVFVDGGSPLERYSALKALALSNASEATVAEELMERAGRKPLLLVTRSPETLDAASRRVLQLVSTAEGVSWMTRDPAATLPGGRHFVASTSVEAKRQLAERRPEQAWIDRFVESPAYDAFLDHGELPPDDALIGELAEPRRSFLGALAILGVSVECSVAERFLAQVSFDHPLEQLTADGLTFIENGTFHFVSDAIRNQLLKAIPLSSRPTLAKAAAELIGGLQAATILLDAGDGAGAAPYLWNELPDDLHERVRLLRNLGPSVLKEQPELRSAYAAALINLGRYRDAREVAPDDPIVASRCDRRIGEYAQALSRLDALRESSFESELLRAELLSLDRRYEAASAALARCAPTTEADRRRVAFQRNLIRHETGGTIDADALGGHYLGERLATYCASTIDDAVIHAEASLRLARTIPERVDAWLDRLYTLFSAGHWDGTRQAALEALVVVEQTQGDRAGGGILFYLAFLAADNGQWSQAEQRIEHLRNFYGGTHDEKRLRELDLLTAHLHFSRGRFSEAARFAAGAWEEGSLSQVHEAAALILDEIDWIHGASGPLRSTGLTGNAELTRRWQVLVDRREGRVAINEKPGKGAAALESFRAALGSKRLDLAAKLATAHDLVLEASHDATEDDELRILRIAATVAFPYQPRIFERPWRYANRNRLGHWTEHGSLQAIGKDVLDGLEPGEKQDWISCDEREWFFIEGCAKWPASSREALAAIVRLRSESARLRRLVEQESGAESAAPSIDGIIGESHPIRELNERVLRVGAREVPVCIRGESGTGKELVARAIHRRSTRKQKAFVPVNCAALPENLIESELFGHVRGAFTGADRDRAGLIETTDGGTLFLDEIGEMPLIAQAKLLRFLQEGEFRRVGDTAVRTADVRVVSATNRPLEKEVERGAFREDLYYRISGVEIHLPPLRDRSTDILLLARHFLVLERERHRSGATRLSEEVEGVFLSYGWPGNVRELQNTVRAAHAMAGDRPQIELEHLQGKLQSVRVVRATHGSYQDAVARFRRDLIEKALLEADGNQNRAAALLKISRQALAYQIKELGVLVVKRRNH